MDIAIALSIAITERTLQIWADRSESVKAYAAYPLRGGCELWSVRLNSELSGVVTTTKKQEPAPDFCLSWQGNVAPASAAVNLIPSGKSRLRRALNNVCGGFELSLSKPAAWAASGVLTCALAWIAGSAPVTAMTANALPANTSRTVQCCTTFANEDTLLANVDQPARHRVFSRARDSVYGKGGGGGGGVNNHTNTIKTYTDGGYADSSGGSGGGGGVGGHGRNEQGHANILFDDQGNIKGGDGSSNGHVNFVHSNGAQRDENGTPIPNSHQNVNLQHVNLAADPNHPDIGYHSNNGHGNVGRK